MYTTSTGYRAMLKYRDEDGVVRQVERHGATKAAADRSLKLAVRDRSYSGRGVLTREATLAVVAEAWYEQLRDLSTTTLEAYRYRMDRQVIPALGQLRLRELTVGVLDRHLRAVEANAGVASARMTRSVLSGICVPAAALTSRASPPGPCR